MTHASHVNDHIEHIASRFYPGLACSRKARNDIPREACITLHDSMTLPLFDYCCNVWDACGVTKPNQVKSILFKLTRILQFKMIIYKRAECKIYLDRLQRRAVSIIEGRKVHATG